MLRDLLDDFQLDQLRAALQFIDRRTAAIDIGAHKGIWTLELLKHFEEVTAVEPTELYKQIPSFAKVINAACGAKVGKCSIKPGLKNTGQSYVVEGKSVKLITIDSLELKPDFIKIDVEGMEFDVLKGGKETIVNYRPLVMIEENNLSERYGHEVGRASRLLRNWGMKPLVTFHMFPEKDKNILFGW